MTTVAASEEGTIELEGPFGVRELRNLRTHGRIDCLSLSNQHPFTAKLAKELSGLSSVRWLHLWCTTTRTAMRHIISIPGLVDLHILGLRHPGALEKFAEATELNTFRCDFLSANDLLEISRLPNLEELGAQNATLSARALDAIVGLSKLRKLDLEESELDDEMAVTLAQSTTIDALEVGATLVTARGLRSICTMSQLRYLDIWAIDIQEDDLELLSELPNLEQLSLGGYEGQTTLTSNGVLPRLAALPSLKRVWLDGINVSRSEKAALGKRYEFRN